MKRIKPSVFDGCREGQYRKYMPVCLFAIFLGFSAFFLWTFVTPKSQNTKEISLGQSAEVPQNFENKHYTALVKPEWIEQRKKMLEHLEEVKNRGDRPLHEMHARGAHKRLYEKAYYNGGVVTHHPRNPGEHIVWDIQKGKEVQWGRTAGIRANKDARARRNEENIAEDPERYRKVFLKKARKEMLKEAKRARARGDLTRALMLELNISDPLHPRILLELGYFNKPTHDAGVYPTPDLPHTQPKALYAHLPDPPSVGPGKEFTQAQKRKILEENRRINNSELRSDLSGRPGVEPQQYAPKDNEVHVDHIIPQSKGGSNSYSNAQVLLRSENLEKGASLGAGFGDPWGVKKNEPPVVQLAQRSDEYIQNRNKLAHNARLQRKKSESNEKIAYIIGGAVVVAAALFCLATWLKNK